MIGNKHVDMNQAKVTDLCFLLKKHLLGNNGVINNLYSCYKQYLIINNCY